VEPRKEERTKAKRIAFEKSLFFLSITVMYEGSWETEVQRKCYNEDASFRLRTEFGPAVCEARLEPRLVSKGVKSQQCEI
jgi:hypothetical protein